MKKSETILDLVTIIICWLITSGFVFFTGCQVFIKLYFESYGIIYNPLFGGLTLMVTICAILFIVSLVKSINLYVMKYEKNKRMAIGVMIFCHVILLLVCLMVIISMVASFWEPRETLVLSLTKRIFFLTAGSFYGFLIVKELVQMKK